MFLPAPKQQLDPADQSAIIEYSDGCVLETVTQRKGRITAAQRSYNMYVGRHWLTVAPDESERYVYNRTKTILIAHAALQAGNGVSVKLSPRDSGDPGDYYINLRGVTVNPVVDTLLASIPDQFKTATAGEDGTITQPLPLPPELADQVKFAIEMGKVASAMAQSMNEPPPLIVPPEILVNVNDKTAADALQEWFDTLWEECAADYFIIENAFLNGMVGWQFLFYQWDFQKHCHSLFNTEYSQVLADPVRPDISLSQNAAYDQVLSVEEGMAMYPKLEEVIRANSAEGKVLPAGAYVYQQAAVYDDVHFRRNMLTVRNHYFRYQPYPMEAADALAQGLIVEGQAPVESVAAPAAPAAGGILSKIKGFLRIGGEDVAGVSDDDKDKGLDNDQSVDREADATPTDNATPVEDEGTEGAQPVTPAPTPAMRPAYFLKGTTNEVKPWGPGWPLRYGIRQIKIIVGQVVEDIECPYKDIPLPHNVNFPLGYTPWGQGTPEDLESLQMAANMVLSNICTGTFNNAFPQQAVAESTNKAFPPLARDKYVKSGTTMIVKDDLIKSSGGKLVLNIDPPQMPSDSWKLLTTILDLMDKQGEMAQVLQGQVPAGTSGKAFEEMTTAAQNSIMYRTLRMQSMLKYLAGLMLDAMVKFTPPEVVAKHFRKYDPHVFIAIHNWIKDTLLYDIAIDTQDGQGAAKSKQRRDIMAAQAQGVQISQPTLIEALDKDPDVELQKQVEWQRKIAAAQTQQQGAAAPAQGAAPQAPSNTAPAAV